MTTPWTNVTPAECIAVKAMLCDGQELALIDLREIAPEPTGTVSYHHATQVIRSE